MAYLSGIRFILTHPDIFRFGWKLLRFFYECNWEARKTMEHGTHNYISPTVHFKFPEKIKIGSNCYIGHYTRIWGGVNEKTIIGNNVMIGNGTGIYSTIHEGLYDRKVEIRTSKIIDIPTIIEDNASIAGNVIISGARIGEGAGIAAGSVVISDIPPYAIAVGAPAKVIGER